MLAHDASHNQWVKYQQATADDKSVGGKNMQIMDRYMKGVATSREATAKYIDSLLKHLKFQDATAVDIYKNIELTNRNVVLDDGSSKSMGLLEAAENHANTKRYAVKLSHSNFKPDPSVDNTKTTSDADKVKLRRSPRNHGTPDTGAPDPANCSNSKQSKKTLGKK